MVIDSPKRRELARRLLKGDSTVWLLLESGNQAKDEAASKKLIGRLLALEKELKLPDIKQEDIAAGLLKLHYPFFFLTNGFFMALKKSENAMINNIARNIIVPIIVFYLADYLSADYDSFFWLWVIFQWSVSIILLIIVNYYIKNKLEKSRAIV